jgi:hypothetical protein
MLDKAKRRRGSMTSRLMPALSLRTLDAKALAACLSVLAVLCAYRFYDYWTTGFFVSDEFGYFFDAIHGGIYSDRWFVGWVNIFLFRALGITNVDAYSYLLPFYLFFWTAITFIVFYKLLKLLEFNELTTALSLLSCFALISFILLSMGFLTEPVGLCMAMCAVYFLARYMKSDSVRGSLIFPLLSGCFFGFAAGTREPYNAFLIGGIVIIIMLGLAKRRDGLRTRRLPPKALIAVSILVFVLPSLFFLVVPTQAYTQQVAPISTQLFQSIVSNPPTSGGVVTTITTTTVVNHTTTTITTTQTTAPPAVPFYRQYVATNTLLIFFGGILLGWGPICVAIALGGFLILLQRSIRGKDITARFMLLTSVFALGSYFIVSFIYAPDPYYFSFQDYSTVIRFSDTALPAYFMAAPLFLAVVSKSRKRMLGLAAVVMVFLLVAVPVYEVYASSNFNYTTQNPFELGYRTDAALLRNYFAANDSNQAVDLVGVPYGWTFTPGVQDLHSVQAYAIGQNPLTPEIAYSNFTAMKWSVFYLYVNEPASAFPTENQFLVPFFNSTAASDVSPPYPFALVSSQPVLHGSDFTLYKVQLDWP